MKKSLLIALFALVCGTMAYAQPRAIGGNIGYSVGFSYEHGFGEKNMLDIAVNVPRFDGIGASVTYDWIDPFNTAFPWENKGEWHWYMGVGAGGGIYNYKSPFWYAGVAGHVGVEYDFWFPLQLSIDWRPNVGVTNASANWFNHWGLFEGLSLGVRYRFNN